MILDKQNLIVDAHIPLYMLYWVVETFGSVKEGRWTYDSQLETIKFHYPGDFELFLLKWC